MTILAREQSENLNQRLRELCLAGIPGTQIVNTINSELGLNWTLQGYFSRVKRLGFSWTATTKAGRPRFDAEYLPEDQRQACYEDPAYEARQSIADRLICRECFQILRDGAMQARGERGVGHLSAIHDGMSLKDYRQRNPGTRIFTFERIARDTARSAEEMMREYADHYATPEVRAAADADPLYEEHNGITQYVICRIPRCGFKSVERLTNHLLRQHGKKNAQYLREHNLPPITAREAASADAKRERERIALLRTLAARQVGRTATVKKDLHAYGQRIRELLADGKSTAQITMIMNRETGKTESKDYWRTRIKRLKAKP